MTGGHVAEPRHRGPYDPALDGCLARFEAVFRDRLALLDLPRHRDCPLHPHPGVPGVWSAPGYTACVPDCWTRNGHACPSLDSHRPGYDVYCGESRWCDDCGRYQPACGEDHCYECGCPT